MALLIAAGFASLPYSVARPGRTTDVLGTHGGGELESTVRALRAPAKGGPVPGC